MAARGVLPDTAPHYKARAPHGAGLLLLAGGLGFEPR
jgi:MprA protease rhombosortase-interaction domain-containing protein